jgi:hypothetical protein
MTIHQPRSNIYALFDKLVLLAKGRLIYSGPAHEEALDHFKNLGFVCPLGFNLADYLVDLTMHAVNAEITEAQNPDHDISLSRVNSRPSSRRSVRSLQEEELFTSRLPSNTPLVSSPMTDRPSVGSFNSKLVNNIANSEENHSSQFKELIEGYLKSSVASQIDQFINFTTGESEEENQILEAQQPTIAFSSWYTNKHQASWWMQFKILSDRNLKNLVRNPDLLKAQYIITFFMALSIGSMYWKITNDVAGFQNRLGFFFFSFVLFAFMCIASIPVRIAAYCRLFLLKGLYSLKSEPTAIIAHLYILSRR